MRRSRIVLICGLGAGQRSDRIVEWQELGARWRCQEPEPLRGAKQRVMRVCEVLCRSGLFDIARQCANPQQEPRRIVERLAMVEFPDAQSDGI